MRIRINSAKHLLGWSFLSLLIVLSASTAQSQVKIMPLGNSITDGTDGATDNAGYRNDLSDSLDVEGASFDFVGQYNNGPVGYDNDHQGLGGQEANEMLIDIRNNNVLQNNPPDIVLLHIGTNDISSGQGAGSTKTDIEDIIDEIVAFDNTIQIILASLIPRNDGNDGENDNLNKLLSQLYIQKRDAGVKIFWAGMNEVFKCNSSWAAQYMSDAVHPNDAGYAVMAGVWINAIMNAINNTDITVSDNFERVGLGNVWDADPEYVIQQNGAKKDLVNTAASGDWAYLAIYKGVTNPGAAKMVWSSTADVGGAELSGLAVYLDSCDPAAASGYAITVRAVNNEIRLWLIQNGVVGELIDSKTLIVADPGPNDELKVEISAVGNGANFTVYINNVLASATPLDDIGYNNQQGNNVRNYSGITLFAGQNNAISDFTAEGGADLEAPAQITTLLITSFTATSATLTWDAVGDDGNTGNASSYDLRYSTVNILNDTDFNNATQALGTPIPSTPGTQETFVEINLLPETTYYFAIKAVDDEGNKGSLSTVPSVTTNGGDLFTDDFNRAGPDPGINWSHGGTFEIASNELTNTSLDADTWDLNVYNAQKNPLEVSFKWSLNADAGGIDQGGLAVMLDAPDQTANGYLITHRTAASQIRLWEIPSGGDPQNALIFTPTLGEPQPGDEFRIRMFSDPGGNHFEVWVNGILDQTITDSPPLHVDPAVVSQLYSGVMLAGGKNNNIDDFKVLTSPISLTIFAGSNQIGTVGTALDTALTVRLLSGDGDPLVGDDVLFSITQGGGTIVDPSGNVMLEAESGTLTGVMAIGSDGSASQGSFIHLPEAGGANNLLGDAIYSFNVTEAGDYIVWGRVIAPDGQGDSFLLQINSGAQLLWSTGVHASWTWSKAPIDASFTLIPGQHTLTINGREDGTQLDQIVITKDPFFTPSGIISAGSQLLVSTDINGEASASWILGTSIAQNPNIISASFSGFSVDFFATAQAGQPALMAKTGDFAIAAPATPVLLEVILTDQFGNEVANEQTDWSVITGNGTLLSPQEFTDTFGMAGNTLTTSTDTAVTQVQVTSPNYIGEDVIFNIFAEAGPPDQILIDPVDSGDGQIGTAGQPLIKPFRVVVKDDLGSPASGHNVTFSVISGGGNFSGQSSITVLTDSIGIATATMTLGPSVDAPNQAQATSFFAGTSTPLNGSPVGFTATSAKPTEVLAVSPLSHNGTAGLPLADSIEVRILDELGGFVAGYPVTFSVIDGGGKVNGNSASVEVTTDANGIAKIKWTLGSIAGVNNNHIDASATFVSLPLAGSPIQFSSSATEGTAQNLNELSGNSQSGMILTGLSEPFVVEVTDGINPIQNWIVTFTVMAGGGNFDGATTKQITTDANGKASITLTLGSEAGTPENPFNNVVEAVAENQGAGLTGSPVTFVAQALATGAENLDLIAGGGQIGQAGLPLPDKIQAKITDGTGNAIAGHPVTFVITGVGGGTINGTEEVLVTINTDANGIAEVDWYLGGNLSANAQEMIITATDGINNLNGSPGTVTATATTGPVDLAVSTVTSDAGTVAANGQAQANITVTLTDKFGNPINEKTVFLETTDASITPPVDITDASGKANFSVSSTVAGVKAIVAKIAPELTELSNPAVVNFTAGAADQIALDNGNNQTANVGTAVASPITVLITDNFNNGVSGVNVDFVVTSGGGSIVESNSIQTGSDGIASANWILGSTPGSNRVEARVAGLTGSPVPFTATGVAAVATTMEYVQGCDQDNFSAGSLLPEPIEVKVTDANGKAVAGVEINFNVQIGGGSVSDNPVATDYMGVARTFFTLGPGVGTNILSANNSSLSGSPITCTFESVVGPPAILAANFGTPGTGSVNSTYSISLIITDINGNPVAGAHSNFAIIAGSATIQAQDNATSSNGTAVAQLLLPTTVGMVVVRGTSNALPGFYQDFEIDVIAGGATDIAIAGGNNQTGTVGRELVYPLEALATDTYGNPVPGLLVQWLVVVGGGSLNTASSTTDENGIASNSWTIGASPGNNQVFAITSLSPSTLPFDATGVTNNFPEFVGLADISVTEGNLLEFQVTATDNDGDPLTYGAEGGVFSLGASFNAGNRTFSWTPGLQQSGDYEVTFTATDNQGGFDAETITISVDNSNSPPEIVAFAPQNTDIDFIQGPPINFSVTVQDANNDQLSYVWVNNGSTVSVSPTYDFLTGQVDPKTYDVIVTVSDGQDQTSMAWKVDVLVTSVELASFAAQFNDFKGVEVVWATSREIDNLGFNVLRGRSKAGTFSQINAELIPRNTDGDYIYFDKSVEVGTRYYYMLEDVDVNGLKSQHGPIAIDVAAPDRFELSQNYPNPFNPETKIRYQLPQSGQVAIKVYDILGREITTLLNEEKEAGFHIINWNARDKFGKAVSSGVYYYQIVSGDFRETKKMLLLK